MECQCGCAHDFFGSRFFPSSRSASQAYFPCCVSGALNPTSLMEGAVRSIWIVSPSSTMIRSGSIGAAIALANVRQQASVETAKGTMSSPAVYYATRRPFAPARRAISINTARGSCSRAPVRLRRGAPPGWPSEWFRCPRATLRFSSP
jgi:hypothetical protein